MSEKKAAVKMPRRYGIGDGLRDTFAVAGAALLAAGCWQIYPPAGLIAPGVVLLGLSVAGAWPRGPRE